MSVGGLLSRVQGRLVGAWSARNAGRGCLPRPVISVGNLEMGGTGKTPFTIELARLLSAEGYLTCILSRGYGGRRDHEPLVVSDLHRVLAGPSVAGDEPFLMARSLPGVPVVVGADRLAAGRKALEAFPVHAFLLDDGFQHRRLRRDVDLVLLDATDPWAGGRLWPWGGLHRGLREPPRGLARADAIVLTRTQAASAEGLTALREELARLAPGVPVLTTRTQAAGFRRLTKPLSATIPDMTGTRVLAFAGIARPGAFFEDLEGLGAAIVGRRAFRDHHAYSETEVRALLRQAEELGASALVTTGKDAVRLPLGGIDADRPFLSLGRRFIVDDAAALGRVLSKGLAAHSARPDDRT